jgi:hypothetical protein
MATIKAKRGLEANLGSITLGDGEFAITTDTKKLYVGLAGVKILLVNTSTSGDMQKNIYDTDNDGIVDQAETVEWGGVLNKPIITTTTTSATAPSAPNSGEYWNKVL